MTRKPTIRTRIRPDLLDAIEACMGTAEGHRNDPEFLALCERIAGKEVDLVFAFEALDDNYWLPNCCWRPICEVTA